MDKNTPTTPEPAEQPIEEKTDVQIVIFSLDTELFAVDVVEVIEVIKMTKINPIPNSPEYIQGFVNLRGKIISVLDLEKRFGLVRNKENKQKQNIIVVDDSESQYGVIVDTVREVITISKDNLHDAPSSVESKVGSEFIQGVVILENEEDKKTNDQNDATEEPVQPEETKQDNKKSPQQKSILLLSLRKLLSESDRKSMKGGDNAQHKSNRTTT